MKKILFRRRRGDLHRDLQPWLNVFHELVMGEFFKKHTSALATRCVHHSVDRVPFVCYTIFQAYLLPHLLRIHKSSLRMELDKNRTDLWGIIGFVLGMDYRRIIEWQLSKCL